MSHPKYRFVMAYYLKRGFACYGHSIIEGVRVAPLSLLLADVV